MEGINHNSELDVALFLGASAMPFVSLDQIHYDMGLCVLDSFLD